MTESTDNGQELRYEDSPSDFPLSVRVDGDVAEIRLRDPRRGNALSTEMLRALISSITAIDARPDVRVVVISAVGSVFCGGLDRAITGQWRSWSGLARQSYLEKYVRPATKAILTSPKLYIAKVEGTVFGAGLDLALACDFQIVSGETQVTAGYVRAGYVPADGAAWILPRLIGKTRAAQMLLTARTFKAEEVKDWGLFTCITSSQDVPAATSSLCHELAQLPGDSLASTKFLIASGMEGPREPHLDLASNLLGIIAEERRP